VRVLRTFTVNPSGQTVTESQKSAHISAILSARTFVRSIAVRRIAKIWKKLSFLVLFAFLAGGLYDFRIALFALACMAGPVAVSVFRGRFWCGNVCPRGSLFDSVLSKVGMGRKIPGVLRSRAFRALVIVVMFATFGVGAYHSGGSAYGIGQVLYRMIFCTTLVGAALSLVYSHRSWCAFCPMGSLASLVARRKKSARVLRVAPSCVSCKLCHKECPLGLVPHEYKGDLLSHPDCIQCGACVLVCPKKAIGYKAR